MYHDTKSAEERTGNLAGDASVKNEGEQKSGNGIRAVLCLEFVICILGLFYITLFSRENSLYRKIITDPLRSYRMWFSGNWISGRAILRNIALFVPIGYLTAELLPGRGSETGDRKRIAAAATAGLTLSLVIEAAQYFTGRGTADLSDILNNTAGALLGAVLLLAVASAERKPAREDGKAGGNKLCIAGGLLLTAATLIGCVQMHAMVGNAASNVSQFDFRIDTVAAAEDELAFSGRCSTYYFPTPTYTIYLKGDRIVRAETYVDGDTFSARADVPSRGTYEVLIQFKDYNRVPTSTYIKNGSPVFVADDTAAPPDDPSLQGAVLKAYSSAFDTYVFEKDGSLLWLIGCRLEDSTEIICHIETNEPEKLPENRRQYGFDNLGFYPAQNEGQPIGHYRVFQKALPASYNITGVSVGFDSKGRVTWSQRFRVEDNDGREEGPLQGEAVREIESA